MSKKAKKAPACIPQSWEEADKLMAEYGELSGKLVTNQAGCEAAVAKVKATYQTAAAPLQKRLDEIFEAIECYAAANRKKLTDDGKSKTVTMTAGAFGWRLCPASVAVRRSLKPADVIANIKALAKEYFDDGSRAIGRTILGFIRIKYEPDKDAMLKNQTLASEIDGIRIVTNNEEFFLDPTVAELPEPK